MGVIAAAVESLGPSRVGAEPTRMEEWARLRRGHFLNRFYLMLAAVMLLIWGALFLFGWLRIGVP